MFHSATLWSVARQAPLSMEFSRQEYWSGLPFPSFRSTDQTHISCTGKQMLWHWATKETLTLPLVKDWKFPPIQLSTYPNPLTPMSETGELTLEDPLGEMEPLTMLSIVRSSVNKGGALCIGALRALSWSDGLCLTALSILLASIYHMLP